MGENFQKSLQRKLQTARKSLNLTIKEAADRMGFSNYQALSSIEKGERPVKAYELAKFAKIYCKDIGYFLSEKEPTETLVLWRNKANTPAVKEKENEFIQYCNSYYALEQKAEVKLPETLKVSDLAPESFSFSEVERLAYEYWNEFQLGSRPACSLKKILEDKFGIKILFLNLGTCGSGASAKGTFGSAILLNRNNTPWRSNYDLAHELFHLITWGKFPLEDVHPEKGEKSKIEQWADYFASCLLLPMEPLLIEYNQKLKDDAISILDCIDLAREFSVSTEALLYRLVNLKRVDRKEIKKILEEEEIKLLDRQRRNADHKKLPYLSGRYVYLAFKCYQLNLASKGKLAQYLGIDRGDISQFLQEYGYDDKGDYDLELSTS